MTKPYVSTATVVPLTTCACCFDSTVAFVCTGKNCDYAMCKPCIDRMQSSLHIDGYKCPACRRPYTFELDLPLRSTACPRWHKHKYAVACTCWYSAVLGTTYTLYSLNPMYSIYAAIGAIAITGFNLCCTTRDRRWEGS